MKIKELLTEGPLDYLKGLVKTGNLAGASAANQQAAGDKFVKQVTKDVIGKWNDYYGKTGDKNIAQWATKFFNRNVEVINPPNVDDASDVNDYLLTLVKAYYAEQLPNRKQATTTSVPPTVAQRGSNIGATGRRGANEPPKYVSPLGVTIIQDKDPWIAGFDGKKYMINDKGNWAINGGKAEAPQVVQAEMDKVFSVSPVR